MSDTYGGVQVRRFEGGDMIGIIRKTFEEVGVELMLVARTFPTHPKYRLDGKGKQYGMKELMQKADEIRRERGLEPLWHES